jgi:hypothetical protein
MHAPILSQSQLDQLNQPIMGCNPETSETPEWRSLWWCIRNVPGDVCRYLYFMRFTLSLLYGPANRHRRKRVRPTAILASDQTPATMDQRQPRPNATLPDRQR